MIDGFGGLFDLECDVCGEDSGEVFNSFYDAVDYKKESGWKSRKNQGEWEDVCPSCAEER